MSKKQFKHKNNDIIVNVTKYFKNPLMDDDVDKLIEQTEKLYFKDEKHWNIMKKELIEQYHQLCTIISNASDEEISENHTLAHSIISSTPSPLHNDVNIQMES